MAGDKTGIGDGGKSDGNGDKVGEQATASRAMERATVTLGDNGPVLVAPFCEIWHRQQSFLQPFLKNVVP